MLELIVILEDDGRGVKLNADCRSVSVNYDPTKREINAAQQILDGLESWLIKGKHTSIIRRYAPFFKK